MALGGQYKLAYSIFRSDKCKQSVRKKDKNLSKIKTILINLKTRIIT